MKNRPTALDLFAGCGGLSLGLEQAGFDVVSALEYDPVHAATHEFNFPLTETLCADIQAVDTSVIREAVSKGAADHGNSSLDARTGEVDLIAGGPPCQGFSFIGKRLVDDERNQLVFHYFRVVNDLRPKYFVMENVPGMRAGGHSGILSKLIEEFEAIGYNVSEPKILNAAHFGVPQSRTRLILIGSREDQDLVLHPEPLVTPVPKRPGQRALEAPTGLDLGPTVWDAIGDLPNLDTFDALQTSDEVRLSDHELEDALASSSEYAKKLRGIAPDSSDFSHPRVETPNMLTSSRRTRHTAKSISRFEKTLPGETEPVSRFYRLHPDGLSNTLRAGTGSERGAHTSPRPLHPKYARVISVREAARLHSFPDWFRLHATKWHGFRQVGNSVAPLVGRAIGRSIREGIGSAPVKPSETIASGSKTLLKINMSQAAEHFGALPENIPAQRIRPQDKIAA